MKKIAKAMTCVLLSIAFIFSFSGCSQTVEVTDQNVRETVEIATKALQEFDTKKLKKYVDSGTLSYIVNLAEKHDQFGELGKAMFESLTIEIVSIDLEAKTVEANVMNKDLYILASNFAYDLTTNYTTMELLSLLNDDYFLDSSLAELTNGINESPEPYEAKTVTLNIVEGKKNLVLSVDEEAENAISGGAVEAVKGITG